MTSQLGLIRMLMWHHGGMIRGTWHVLAACWRALDGCQHIQARGKHMKTREKEGHHSAGAWKRVTRKVFIPTRLGRLRVDGKVVTPAVRGKEGLLSDGAWKSVTALMMKISPGIDTSGDDLHRSGVCFPSLKRLRVDRRVVTSAARGKEGLLSDGAWKSVTALMMKISPGINRSGDVLHRSGVCFPSLKAKKEVWRLCNFCIASQEMMLLENHWTAVKRAEEQKTCKRQESDRSGHRFGAGLGGSDAFSPLDLGTRGGSVALHLAGSGQLVHGAGRHRRGFIPRIRGGHLCMMRCWFGEVSRLIPVEDKDESRFAN
uniref:Uncharacterized protein n=1 Tax=Fagus sylvatica TaxID=28930 RepID=A0A2N9H5Q7_FAGSY